jgi:predicted phosphoribosyltransferase
MTAHTFSNRKNAGIQLAHVLEKIPVQNSLVLALPQGGVLVGIEISKYLHIPLDTILARAIHAPHNPESSLGAIAPDDVVIIDLIAKDVYDIGDREMNEIVSEEVKKMTSTMELYKSGSYAGDSMYDTVIIVDDGLADSKTVQAAVHSVRQRYNPKMIIFAAPLCGRDTELAIMKYVDKVVCLSEPDDVITINLWYDDNEPLDDVHIAKALAQAAV